MMESQGINRNKCNRMQLTKIKIIYTYMQLSGQLLTEYMHHRGPPLCSKGQSVWLQIQRPEFDSRRYQIFCEVAGLERGPLSLMSTTEELLETKSSSSGLETRKYGSRDPSSWPRGTLYQQKLALSSPTSGGHSVGIVRSRTQAMEFS
jgi:hypothetical protein